MELSLRAKRSNLIIRPLFSVGLLRHFVPRNDVIYLITATYKHPSSFQ